MPASPAGPTLTAPPGACAVFATPARSPAAAAPPRSNAACVAAATDSASGPSPSAVQGRLFQSTFGSSPPPPLACSGRVKKRLGTGRTVYHSGWYPACRWTPVNCEKLLPSEVCVVHTSARCSKRAHARSIHMQSPTQALATSHKG